MRLFFLFPSSVALAVSISAMAPAMAQVQRCTDTRTGQVTYTDGPCSSHQRSVQVLPAQTPEEKAAQARQYEEAQARWQVEQARTQALRRAQAEKSAAQAAAAAAQRPPVQIIQPPAAPADPVLVPYPVYPVYPVYPDYSYPPPYPSGHWPRAPHGKPPPPQPQPQPQLQGPWQCNVFRCYDGKGNVRPRP